MDNGAEAELPGKHGLDDGAAVWAPVAGDVNQQSRPMLPPGEIPLPRRHDPLADTDAHGLRKFNIGLVPASVTPPRTWKRAAWFAVVASAGVLIGLAIAAANLVGGNGPVERIGLPGYPSDMPRITDLASNAPRPTTKVQQQGGTKPSAGARGGTDAAPAPGSIRTVTTSVAPGPGSKPPAGGPIVTTVPNVQTPVVDGDKIAETTERFYQEMATNTDTALTLTTDNFRSNTEALLEGRLVDVSLIEVKEIAVDPSKGITISLLQVTKKDGTISTEKRELSFTTSAIPLINGERLTLGG